MGGGYIAKARPLCHSEERSDEESKATARLLRLHPDKRDAHWLYIEIGKPYVDRPER